MFIDKLQLEDTIFWTAFINHKQAFGWTITNNNRIMNCQVNEQMNGCPYRKMLWFRFDVRTYERT